MIAVADLSVLALGDPVQLGPSDTLRVKVQITYTLRVKRTLTLYATISGFGGVVKEASKPIALDAAAAPTTKEESIDILVAPGGVGNGTYNLTAEIKEFPATRATVSNGIILAGFPAAPVNLTAIIGPVLVMGLMGAMVGMMTPKEGRP